MGTWLQDEALHEADGTIVNLLARAEVAAQGTGGAANSEAKAVNSGSVPQA